jgi:hypothetical protein
MQIFLIVLGAAMIAGAMHDIFHTLFHPAGRGAMSDWLDRRIWAIFRAIAERRRGALTLGGPVIFLSVISVWALLIIIGFALIYYTRIHTGFAVAPGMDPAKHRTFFDAFNVSLGALITIAGDFNSRSKILRLLMGAEAVIGFGLLTAAVSFLLSVYRVLEQRRSLAERATLQRQFESETGARLLQTDEGGAHSSIMTFAADLVQLRNSLTQFPVSYYFVGHENETSLPAILEYLRGLAESAEQSQKPAIRFAGGVLMRSIREYLKTVARIFLRCSPDDMQAVLRAYAKDHLRELVPYEG